MCFQKFLIFLDIYILGFSERILIINKIIFTTIIPEFPEASKKLIYVNNSILKRSKGRDMLNI